MPSGEQLHNPPEERRCTATVRDKRSKRIGERCTNYVMPGRDVCNAHAGVPQKIRQRQLEREHLLAPPELEDPQVRAREYQRQLAANQLEKHYALLDEKNAEQREKAQNPPRPLTDAEKATGSVWVRDYDAPDQLGWNGQPKLRTGVLRDSDGREFVWRVRTQAELIAEPVNLPKVVSDDEDRRRDVTPHPGAAMFAWADTAGQALGRSQYIRNPPENRRKDEQRRRMMVLATRFDHPHEARRRFIEAGLEPPKFE